MKYKNLLLFFMGLTLLFFPAFSWAIPLSIEENMKAIASNPSGINGGFAFIVFGDSRGNEKKFLGILDKAKTFKPLFILNTGDIVQEGQAEEYENYKKQIEGYGIPILHIPGNHDLRSGKDNYQRYIGETNWFFDYGNYRLIGLDNTLGKFDEKTLEFARNTLNKEKS